MTEHDLVVLLAAIGLWTLWALLSFPASILAGSFGGFAYLLLHGREATKRRSRELSCSSPLSIVLAIEYATQDRLECLLPGITQPPPPGGLLGIFLTMLHELLTRTLWPLYAAATALSSYDLVCGRLPLRSSTASPIGSTAPIQTAEDEIPVDTDGYLEIEPWQVRRRVTMALDLQLEVSGLETDSTLALAVSTDEALHNLGSSLEAAVRQHIARLDAGVCQ